MVLVLFGLYKQENFFFRSFRIRKFSFLPFPFTIDSINRKKNLNCPESFPSSDLTHTEQRFGETFFFLAAHCHAVIEGNKPKCIDLMYILFFICLPALYIDPIFFCFLIRGCTDECMNAVPETRGLLQLDHPKNSHCFCWLCSNFALGKQQQWNIWIFFTFQFNVASKLRKRRNFFFRNYNEFRIEKKLPFEIQVKYISS